MSIMETPCEVEKGRINCRIARNNRSNAELEEYEMLQARPRGVQPAEDPSALSVVDVKMYNDLNKADHHTEKYDNPNLIVRRGQEFTIGIVFRRPYNPQTDNVALEFVIGSNPSPTKYTLITVSLGKSDQPSSWKGRILETGDNETKVGITPAADSIIGLFSTYVTIITEVMKKRTKRTSQTDFYVLFNPWSPSDQVFMANENERQEFVLNDAGVIYSGVINNLVKRPWSYGQFKHGVLDACLFVLDFGGMPLQYRGDVTKLIRTASAMINSQDDDGVLVGNWSENFSLGTAPTAWTGSAEILLSYAVQGGVPVKFGQCWVFAGTFNTLLRCLGIPARVITNYSSAHDNMGDLRTDIILDEDGRVDDSLTVDSIWNFHCWNEVFMQRSDIPAVYSGWQVVDATPQETSDGYYRCGPTPVKAIKEGELSYQFDASFVFAEVNSDVVFYKQDRYGRTRLVSTNTTYVGQLIVTKSVGSTEPEYITDNYKYPEGSPEDQTTMKRATALGMRRFRTTQPDPDVLLQLQASQQNNYNISLIFLFTNLSKETRTISLALTGKVDFYTGSTRSVFKFFTQSVTLDPLQAKQGNLIVTADEYRAFVQGQPFLSFVMYGLIQETSMYVTDMEVIHLDVPPLSVEVSGELKVGEDMFVTVKFTNTTGTDLNDVTLRMEGTGLLPVKVKTYSQISKGSTVKWIESVTPQLPGPKLLLACLDCTFIRNLCGQVDVFINPDSQDD
ncbi:coagulation factor XIII A chain [Astyanax mexicanus]|uniref:protein-glutamine gamma-glutamyltransferase n=1 Tax=Astyanax mexicanus TaxID=7994 RepID=A0A8T2M514_ASTMX|nr:coagulation factor XIII A chain [Astyanax mexicanus]